MPEISPPLSALLWACAPLVLVPAPAQAFELSGGVSVGGVLVGIDPLLAVSPHAGIAWRTEGGFLFVLHDVTNVVPAMDELGVGVYNQTSIGLGYASRSANFSAGPSLSIYSMPACGALWCGRVVGLAPGGHAQVNVYLIGPLGVSVSANVDWVGLHMGNVSRNAVIVRIEWMNVHARTR